MNVDELAQRAFQEIKTHAVRAGHARWNELLRVYSRAAGEVIAENLWPTRCAACGTLGALLCKRCFSELKFIDLWRACPRCGSPYGMHQCCECNSYSLKGINRSTVPFDACVSALHFNKVAAQIVRLRKDGGERRLASFMAFCIACAIPPEWLKPKTVISFIPGSDSALRNRGFDHAKELANEVSNLLNMPLACLLKMRKARDQRGLSRNKRAENVRGSFVVSAAEKPVRVILVDDVYTTGSTAMAASEALKEAGVSCVFVATFARV